jgi:hypothetical protein
MKFTSLAAAAAVALATAGAAQATTTALGAVAVGVPLAFGGIATPGTFIDLFTFTLPPNGGSGYNISNFTFLPAQYNTVFTNFNLVRNLDGIIGNADDTVVASSTSAGAANMSLTFAASAGGSYYLSVIGLTNGSLGGIYNGAISVSAVPEPETYALMLAGIGMIGFMAARRRDRS